MGLRFFLAVKRTHFPGTQAPADRARGPWEVGQHPKVTSELITNQPEKSGLVYSFLGLNQAPTVDKCLLLLPR